jgi:hypothetical protein
VPESAEPHSRTVPQQTETNLEQLLRVRAAGPPRTSAAEPVAGQSPDPTWVLPPASAACWVDVEHLDSAKKWGRIPPADLAELDWTYCRYQALAELLDAGPAPSLDPDLATWAEAFLQRESPELLELLNLDLADEVLLDRWGSSTTTEKNGSASVPQALAQLFAAELGSDPGLNYGHAGLNHTYGYLLSPVPTEFGRKRHRWTSQEVAHTLGIPGKWPLSQGPSPQQGMLAEVTAALESVAPLSRPDAWSSPATATKTAHALAMEELRDLPASGVSTNGKMWRARTRVLRRADLTAEQASEGDQLLLVYSLSVDDRPERYITAFPVSAEWHAKFAATAVESVLKYNASLGA